MSAVRDRYVEAGDSGSTRCALPMRGNQNGHEWRNEFAGAVCDWGGRVYWLARSKSARQQLAIGRAGSGASGRDRRRSDPIDFETKGPVAGMEIGKCAGRR